MNPTFARIARLHDCPVHAVRVVREGDGFLLDLTEELVLPRDDRGRIDIDGAVAWSVRCSSAGSANIRANGCGWRAAGGRASSKPLARAPRRDNLRRTTARKRRRPGDAP